MMRPRLPNKNNWKADLLVRLSMLCEETPFASAFKPESTTGIHLAVFVEPYLDLLMQGKKTIESRFGVNRHAPFEQIRSGDLLVVKKSSGPVCGMCRVTDVWFYRLDPDTWPEIERHAQALCMDGSTFWQKKKAASYATLMQVEDVCRLPEFAIDKEDPRGWVVIKDGISAAQGTLL
jgi:hypothetical protein